MDQIASLGRTDYAGRDGFTWWLGEVEDINDPAQLGRVRVRVFGWYTGHKDKKAYLEDIPRESLPWATVILPTDQAGITSAGTSTMLQPGAVVLGFFMDGEEAQLPCVLGSIRSFKALTDDTKKVTDEEIAKKAAETSRTTIADGANAEENKVNNPAARDIKGNEVVTGTLPKVQSTAPGSPTGGTTPQNSAISIAEQSLPGNVVTNPIKPPSQPQGIGDGVNGPAGNNFERDLERMLTEVAGVATMVKKASNGQLYSLTNGKLVSVNIIDEYVGKIKNFISGAFSGILSQFKELIAQFFQKAIGAIVSAISKIVPLATITAILGIVEKILGSFCQFEAQYIVSYVKSAFSNVDGFVNSLVGQVFSKITDIAGSVTNAVNQVIGNLTGAIQQVADKARLISAALATAKSALAAFGSLKKTFDTIFSFDFTKLSFSGILKIISTLVDIVIGFKSDCGRKFQEPRQKFWLPLLGTTECDSPSEFLSSLGLPTNVGGFGGKTTFADNNYINFLYSDLNPYVMDVSQSLNGSKIIDDATPGKEKRINQGPGGVTVIEDSRGNAHTNVPGNETKIIARDDCKTVKGNKTMIIEGDYTLKVMGNFHLEVLGAFNENTSNGISAKKNGFNDGEKQQKSVQTKSADHQQKIQGDFVFAGNKVELQGYSAVKLTAPDISLKAATITNEASAEIVNETSWITNICSTGEMNFINFLNIGLSSPTAGQFTFVGGPIYDVTQSFGASLSAPGQVRVILGGTIPGGFLDMVNGTTGAHMTIVNTASGGIIEACTGASGAIVNSVQNGLAAYSVATGLYAAGCNKGPAQLFGLPLLLN